MSFPLDEQEFKDQLNVAQWEGRASSLEEMASKAKRRSGDAYAANNDVEAKWWRYTAKWLLDQAGEERKRLRELELKLRL